jgi:hypothetical protein
MSELQKNMRLGSGSGGEVKKKVRIFSGELGMKVDVRVEKRVR